MGAVVLAEERALRRNVAIKILDPQLAQDTAYRLRFAREAEAAARLQHPNIVPIYRVGEAGGLPYFAMQYVDGETLAARVAREQRLSPDEARRIARDVARALTAAHRRGVVHRDVKPHNILLDADDGRALVTDFGIARLTDDSAATATRDQLTGVGRLIGTPRYMSPEQATGGVPVGPPSDLYSLGLVLYEMLSGAFPYEETPGRNPMIAHIVDPIVPLRVRQPAVPADLAEITERLLEKEPTRRFATADALLSALDGNGSGARLSGAGSPAARVGRRPSRRGLLSGAVVVLVLAAAGWLLRARTVAAEDPRRSLLVGYFDNTARDPALEWLRVGGVELLTRALSRWSDLRVVETSRLLDLARKAQIADGVAMSRDDVLRLAREAGVGTAGVGTVLRTGDERSSITLRLYDASSSSLISEATEEVAADSLLPAAFGRLADRVFAIAGAPKDAIIDGEPPTRSLRAYREFVAGLRTANRWRLDSAELHYAAAVEADPAFALAWMRRADVNLNAKGPFQDPAPYIQWADSALKYSTGRPVKERLLIEAFHQFVGGAYGDARANARRLIALDSTNALAWALLAAASADDRFVVKTASGQDSTGYDPNLILAASRKAVALDASNHQTLSLLGSILVDAAYSRPGIPLGRVWLSRERPLVRNKDFRQGPGVFYQMVMLSEDSLRFGPLMDVARATTPAELQRSRTFATEALRGVLDLWLTVGPEEGLAHALRSWLAELDGDWDLAFRSLDRAASLSGWLLPYDPDWARLHLALASRRDSLAQVIADRLEKDLPRQLKAAADQSMPMPVAMLANAQMLAGRIDAAQVTVEQSRRNFERLAPPRMTPMRMLNDSILLLRNSIWPGRTTEAELVAIERRVAAIVSALPDSLKRGAYLNQFAPLAYPAALLGDTARIARLRALLPPPRRALYPGLDAIAAALAGDRAGAERAIARTVADTAYPWPGSRFLAGQAALLIGRPTEALTLLAGVDSSAFDTWGFDQDWMIYTRSLKARGDAALAVGDTATARRYLSRFVRLLERADPVFHPERNAAQAALTAITRGDRSVATPIIR
jgi:eukaryotic-like serine/threonine-protein kinase